MVPKAGKECIRCGSCAAQCPAQAIGRDDPKNTDGKKCVS
ncbi:4Fe-4S binding protein [uncultured Oscillibacter sp.]